VSGAPKPETNPNPNMLRWPRSSLGSRYRRVVKQLVRALLAVAAGGACAASPNADPPLPSPLTLEAALGFADAPHPDIETQRVALELERANLSAVRARYGLTAYFDLVPRWSDPATESGHDLINDSFASLVLSKKLYDFGRTRSLEESAQARVAGREYLVMGTLKQRRLDIMRAFLDVLLADLQFLAADEEMSRLFVRFDDARDRSELGELAEVDIFELETRYREALDIRAESEARQRFTRTVLALLLNRPAEVSADLVRPEFDELNRPTPEFEDMVTRAMNAPHLQALRAAVEAAQSTLAAEHAARRPVLSADIGAKAWEREIGSRNEGVVGVTLRVPIYQGGVDDAAIARAAAVVRDRETRLRQAELSTRRLMLKLIQALDTLRVKRQTAQVREDYRGLAVDRARALYELEVRTNLGESMARLTEAQWRFAKTEFDTVLTWAHLDALTGQANPWMDGDDGR